MRSNSDPTAALLLGFAAGLFSFFKGFRVLREYKLLEDTPRIPIRSVPMGFVHIRGNAESEQVLASPVSHLSCCFYKVEIEEWKSSGRSHSWQPCCTDMDGYRFYLVDPTGRVLIDAHAAEYDLPLSSTRVVDSQQTSDSSQAQYAPTGAGIGGASESDLLQYVSYAQMHRMTERVGQWIDKRFEKAGVAENPQLQARQAALQELFAAIPSTAKTGGAPINIVAKLAAAGGPLKDPEKEQRRLLFLARLQEMESMLQSGQLPIKIPMAHPAATGRYRLREYLVVPGQEYLISGTCVENSAPAADQDRSVIAKGHNEPTFVISAKSDAELNTGLRKRAGLMILGGVALALACFAGLLVHFNLF
jgi:hypothetical protein